MSADEQNLAQAAFESALDGDLDGICGLLMVQSVIRQRVCSTNPPTHYLMIT